MTKYTHTNDQNQRRTSYLAGTRLHTFPGPLAPSPSSFRLLSSSTLPFLSRSLPAVRSRPLKYSQRPGGAPAQIEFGAF